MNSHKMLKYSYWLSIICLIHCISFPILIALLPFIDIVFEINFWLEMAILLSVFFLGSFSLMHAYFSHHKNIKPTILFIIGILLSSYIHFFSDIQNDSLATFLEVFSGAIIAISQFYNIRLTPKSCSH